MGFPKPLKFFVVVVLMKLGIERLAEGGGVEFVRLVFPTIYFRISVVFPRIYYVSSKFQNYQV